MSKKKQWQPFLVHSDHPAFVPPDMHCRCCLRSKYWAALEQCLLRPLIAREELLAQWTLDIVNKKHLKNVGPIRHCEPPHAHSPGVSSGTVARRLRIDVHDNNDNDNAWQRGPLWPHGMGPITLSCSLTATLHRFCQPSKWLPHASAL